MAKVVTFANIKGGSGKSTLCVNIAAMLTKLKFDVCVIDADPQKSTSDWIINTKDPLLSQVTCHEILDPEKFVELDYDFVLIDTQGSLNKELAGFLRVSSLVLVPCRSSRDDIVGQGWIQIFLEKSQHELKKVPLLAVLNGVNKRSQILSHIKQQLSEDGVLVAKTSVSQRVCFSETNVNMVSIIGYNRVAEGELRDLTNELLTYIQYNKEMIIG
ncbi:ParA family protein [bacterium]|nr:ParA family protein [bacterium]